MPIADLPDLTTEELAQLSDGCDGYVVQKACNAAAVAFGSDERWLSRVVVRVRIYGNETSTCGLAVTEDAGADAVLAAVITETFTKGSLSYANVTRQATAIYLTREEGGGTIIPPACEEPTYEPGTVPEGWDSEPGTVVTETTYGGVITGADICAAAVAGEALLFDSDWGPLKAYARRWFEANTLDVPQDFLSVRRGGEAKRYKVEMKVVGFRVPVNVAWQLTTTNTATGHADDPVDQLWEAAVGAWEYTIDDGYPAYPCTTQANGFKLVPVV